MFCNIMWKLFMYDTYGLNSSCFRSTHWVKVQRHQRFRPGVDFSALTLRGKAKIKSHHGSNTALSVWCRREDLSVSDRVWRTWSLFHLQKKRTNSSFENQWLSFLNSPAQQSLNKPWRSLKGPSLLAQISSLCLWALSFSLSVSGERVQRGVAQVFLLSTSSQAVRVKPHYLQGKNVRRWARAKSKHWQRSGRGARNIPQGLVTSRKERERGREIPEIPEARGTQINVNERNATPRKPPRKPPRTDFVNGAGWRESTINCIYYNHVLHWEK